MTIQQTPISDLVIGEPYTNVKMTQLQREVFTSFTVDSVDDNGYSVTIQNPDTTVQQETFTLDAVVYLVTVD